MDYLLLLITIIGFFLSAYAAYVEKRVAKDKGYRAACDISSRISCTKAFASGYGKVFGISNGLSGIIFYAFVFILLMLNLAPYIFYLSVLAVIGSIYLAYVLHFKVKAVCLVCYSIYAVNIFMLLVSYARFR